MQLNKVFVKNYFSNCGQHRWFYPRKNDHQTVVGNNKNITEFEHNADGTHERVEGGELDKSTAIAHRFELSIHVVGRRIE